MITVPSIDPTYLTMICDALVSLDDVISDGELGILLLSSDIPDANPNASRHRRLLTAMIAEQERARCADSIAKFLRRTGYHIKTKRGEEAYKRYIREINQIMSFAGLELDIDANLTPLVDGTKKMYVAPEAEERAKQIKALIKARNLHPDLELSCRPEFFVRSGYFVFLTEATKVLLEKVKSKSNLHTEGPGIAEQAFAFPWKGEPILAFNQFETDNDRSEQFSLMVLLKAMFLIVQDEQSGKYRHGWKLSQDDALDLLTVLSFFHRKIDKAKKL